VKHFLLEEKIAGRQSITLTGEHFHYLIRVRRLSRGDSFPAVDAEGIEVVCMIESIENSTCTIRLTEKSVHLDDDNHADTAGCREGSVSPRITLFQCLPKGGKLDQIVRQATECGVTAVVPVRSSFSVSDIPTERLEKRLSRWRRIAREAAQQSGATRPPEIEPPLEVKELAQFWSERSRQEQSIGLIFHHENLDTSRYLDSISIPVDDVAICIGPEGGFADDEVEMLQSSGFTPIYLGSQVLRTETAALYAIASVQVYLRTMFPVSYQ
jgi:16S rRNA (uracil1498-N3)-methyltransferase